MARAVHSQTLSFAPRIKDFERMFDLYWIAEFVLANHPEKETFYISIFSM